MKKTKPPTDKFIKIALIFLLSFLLFNIIIITLQITHPRPVWFEICNQGACSSDYSKDINQAEHVFENNISAILFLLFTLLILLSASLLFMKKILKKDINIIFFYTSTILLLFLLSQKSFNFFSNLYFEYGHSPSNLFLFFIVLILTATCYFLFKKILSLRLKV